MTTTSRIFGRAIRATNSVDQSAQKDSPMRTVTLVDLDRDVDMTGDSNMNSSKSGRRVIGLQSSHAGSALNGRLSSSLVPSQRGALGENFTNNRIRSIKRNSKYSDGGGLDTGRRRIQRDVTRVTRPSASGNSLSPDDGMWKHDKFQGAVKIGSTIFIRHLPQIIVGRNPTDLLDQRLAQHFSQIGPVIGVKIERGSMPSAYVYFIKSPDAAKAVEQLNGKPLTSMGGNVVLKFSELKPIRHEYSDISDYTLPSVSRRTVKTLGSAADDEAWMCDSRHQSARAFTLN